MIARDLRVLRGRFTLEIDEFAGGAGGTAILGPNGAGKTTLLLALQGLIPHAGAVERPPRAAAVFARPAVLRGTARWNVAVVVRDVLQAGEPDANDRARDALERVGLQDVAAVDARTLSTGQRQRLALARALACEPDVLFLDEPFANVDADARVGLRSLVASYAARTGCEVLVATASLADAVALSQDAVVLHDGRVTHRGPIAGLGASADPYVAAVVAESRAALAEAL